MIRAPLDLRYTHEMAACAATAIVVQAPGGGPAARDLTARLRCLAALIDAERCTRDKAAVTPRMH